MLSRNKLNKLLPEDFIVFSLLLIDLICDFLDLFLVITVYAPFNGLFFAFKLPYHLLGGFHLCPLFLQLHIDLLILLVYTRYESSFNECLWRQHRDHHKIFFVLKFSLILNQ